MLTAAEGTSPWRRFRGGHSEIQGLRLAGSSRALHANSFFVRSECFLGDPGYGLLVCKGVAGGGQGRLWAHTPSVVGAASSGSGAEHGAIPRVTHSRKSPTNIVPSWLCLKWTQSIITAGDLGCPRHHQWVVAVAAGYQSPPRPRLPTLGSVPSKSLGLVSSTRTVSVSLNCKQVFWGWGVNFQWRC